MSYVVVWQFEVRPGAEARFEAVYGPDGDWVKLFRLAEGFLRTELLRDREDSARFLVLDHWRSAENYQSFRDTHSAAYNELDKRCEALTIRESPLGSFRAIE